jgi:integrase
MNFPTLSAHAEEFLALKRAVAKVDPHRNTQDRRSLKHREKLLRNFVAYWRDRGCPWPMRSSLVLDWIAVGSHRQHPYRDQRRFYVVRAFLQQIRIFESATEIPENIYRPLYRRRTPHLYSEDDIARLMDAVWQLQTVTPFRQATVYALIGLLASTGLRIGEALALNVDDVKLRTNPPHLLISDSKFGNSRNVVLHPSVAKQLRKYLIQRSKALASRHVKTFFMNRFGKRLNYNATAIDVSQASEARWHPGPSWSTRAIHSFFASLIRGEETDPLASREKRRAGTSSQPGCVSRPCGPRKYVLVSQRHSRTSSRGQCSL